MILVLSGHRQEVNDMRVIAGDYKGRRLTPPADNSVRPTTDKVKEALFSIMTDRIWGIRNRQSGNRGIEQRRRSLCLCR